MTKEEIIKAWFAIDELGGENVHTKLSSFHLCGKNDKMYHAEINFGFGSKFFSQDTDRFKAMERAINNYSASIIKNEIKDEKQ